MLIIPVIDLYAGNVVHAFAGQRESYKNINTPLCEGSSPVTIVKALLSLHPFTTIYIADLNAIKDEGNNNEIITELLLLYPDICFWLDAGKYTCSNFNPKSQLRQIIASEIGITQQQLADKWTRSNRILSLDFLNNEFMGDQNILKNVDEWPEDIIIMSLNRVGTNQGPDLTRLSQIITLTENRRLYAAGGVRNDNDLEVLHSMGMSGVLLATALHQGKISSQSLLRYS
jgi:phosphoribosylformimino-5-aminoimidazole carboxamide ribotide isomerase